MAKRREVPRGSIFKRGRRWWYKVRLPGKDLASSFPLVPQGAKMATRNRPVAVAVARSIYRQHFEGQVRMRMADLVGAFERTDALTGGNLHVSRKVKVIREFCQIMGVEDPAAITPGLVEEYMVALRTRGLSPKSIANKRGYLGRFCQFLCAHDELETNPVRLTRPPKVRVIEPVHLAKEDLETALATAEAHGCLEPVAFAIYTGMRLGEIMALRWKDIREAADGPIVVVGGAQATKTNRVRSVPVSKKLGKIIDGMERGKPDDLVFPERSERQWNRLLKPVRAAIPVMDRSGGGWHDFRRTAASLLVQGGVDIYLVSKILGHSSVVTTSRYYAHLGAEHGRAALEKL